MEEAGVRGQDSLGVSDETGQGLPVLTDVKDRGSQVSEKDRNWQVSEKDQDSQVSEKDLG